MTRRMLIAVLVTFLALTILVPGTVEAQSLPCGQGQGTSLEVWEHTASADWVRTYRYDWSIDKSLWPDTTLEPLTLWQGETGELQYTITVNRQVSEIVDTYTYSARFCLQNDIENPTSGLKVEDQLEYWNGSDYVLLGTRHLVAAGPEMEPGEYRCYNVNETFVPPAGAVNFRHRVFATIYNHGGSCGWYEFGTDKADFTLPSEPTQIREYDADATVTDVQLCPVGFSGCQDRSWTIEPPTIGTSYSQQLDYTTYVTNDSAPCEEEFILQNTATLEESSSRMQRVAMRYAYLRSGPCDDGEGCTPGYWKQSQHLGSWEPTGYAPADTLDPAFGYSEYYGYGTDSLLDALGFRGGGGDAGAARILFRAATAALLNATHPDVDYQYSADYIVGEVEYATGYGRDAMLELAEQLDAWNNRGYCPLGRNPAP